MDAIYATQEALMTHLKDGGHPYLCLFDIEKAFDSVEFPILLQHLYIRYRNQWKMLEIDKELVHAFHQSCQSVQPTVSPLQW